MLPHPLPRSTALLVIVALISLSPLLLAARRRVSHPEVLIVVNDNSPMSVAIGEAYRVSRGVPLSNVLALDLPTADPTLGTTTHETFSVSSTQTHVLDPIEDFLVNNGLEDQIEIIVTVKGVPLRVTGVDCAVSNPPPGVIYQRDCTQASVDAEISLLGSTAVGSPGVGVNGEMVNPYFDSDQSFAAWRDANPGSPLRYMVARITGLQTPTAPSGVPEDVELLISRAKGSVGGGSVLIDEDPLQAQGLRPANLALLGATAGMLQALGLPVLHDTSSTFVSNTSGLIGYASWGSNDKSDAGPPYYGLVGGNNYPGSFQPRAIATDIVSTNGRTFTAPVTYGQSTLADLVALGVAGLAGNAWEPLVGGVAQPQQLLRHYYQGAPAIEAYYRSVPYLGWMNLYVGDPLMEAQTSYPASNDTDGDGVLDGVDNCTLVPNADQRDTNSDGYGNLCDGDVDGDGVVTTSWGVTVPPSARGDLERIQLDLSNPDHDLDGDGDVDGDDIGWAVLRLFFPPGPSGYHP